MAVITEVEFIRLFEERRAAMINKAKLFVKQEAIAEDIVQEVFIKAWLHLSTLQKKESFGGWLTRILTNECISYLRHQKAMVNILDALQIEHEDKVDIDTELDLFDAIEMLPEKQREAITLHYIADMTTQQVATHLKISENTIKKRLIAGLENLRRIFRVTPPEK